MHGLDLPDRGAGGDAALPPRLVRARKLPADDEAADELLGALMDELKAWNG